MEYIKLLIQIIALLLYGLGWYSSLKDYMRTRNYMKEKRYVRLGFWQVLDTMDSYFLQREIGVQRPFCSFFFLFMNFIIIVAVFILSFIWSFS